MQKIRSISFFLSTRPEKLELFCKVFVDLVFVRGGVV
jgi:hypothetical protein